MWYSYAASQLTLVCLPISSSEYRLLAIALENGGRNDFSYDSFRLQSLKWKKLGPRKRSSGHVWWVGSENHLNIPWKRYLKCPTTLKGLLQSVMFLKRRLVGCFRAIFKGNSASFSENDFTSWVYYMNLPTCFLCSFVCITFLKLSFCFNNNLELCANFQAWRSEDDAR